MKVRPIVPALLLSLIAMASACKTAQGGSMLQDAQSGDPADGSGTPSVANLASTPDSQGHHTAVAISYDVVTYTSDDRSYHANNIAVNMTNQSWGGDVGVIAELKDYCQTANSGQPESLVSDQQFDATEQGAGVNAATLDGVDVLIHTTSHVGNDTNCRQEF